jgi:hypothetical protein
MHDCGSKGAMLIYPSHFRGVGLARFSVERTTNGWPRFVMPGPQCEIDHSDFSKSGPSMSKRNQKTRWLAPFFLARCVSGPAFAGNVIFDINYIDEVEPTTSAATYTVD